MDAALTSLLVEAIKDVCHAEAASVLCANGDGGLTFTLFGVDGAPDRDVTLATGEGVAGTVFVTGQPSLVQSPDNPTSERASRAADFVVRSLIAVPLIDELGVKVGVAEALNPAGGEGFNQDDLEALLRAAPALGVAVAALTRPEPNEGAMARFYRAVASVMATHGPEAHAQNGHLERAGRHQQIHQAQQSSDDRMAGLARMAAGIAHEVNNPLAIALSNIRHVQTCTTEIEQLVARVSDTARADAEEVVGEIREALTDTQDALDRISGIVSRLMVFGDLDTQREDDVDLALEGSRIAALLEHHGLGATSPIPIRVAVGSVPLLRASRARVQQLLVEIVDNAMRAAQHSKDPSGGRVELEVSTDGATVHLTVADNGPGMDPETQRRIFDPFFTTKAEWRAVGLGLSVAYGVVRAHGGTLVVDSSPSRGSRVTAMFPVRPRESTCKPPPTPRPPRSGRYYEDIR